MDALMVNGDANRSPKGEDMELQYGASSSILHIFGMYLNM